MTLVEVMRAGFIFAVRCSIECGFMSMAASSAPILLMASKARPSLASKARPVPTTSKARLPMVGEAASSTLGEQGSYDRTRRARLDRIRRRARLDRTR
eukprot:6199832-Pleurochrysis_carterae.AAC.1